MPTLHSKRALLLLNSSESSSCQKSNATINDLPSEMLLEVFSYLSQDQLLNTIPKVCKRWGTLHSDPTLYTRFTFTAEGPSTDDAIKLLSMAKWLQSLKLHNRTETNAILATLANATPSNQRLETLVLRDCKGSPSRNTISSVSLLGALDRCNLLQHLSLKGSNCRSRKVYSEIGLRLPSLRSLDLGKSSEYDSQALLNIADNCRYLEEIRAFETYADEEEKGIAPFTDLNISSLCNRLQYLKVVKITVMDCTDASMFTLATCQQLTTLALYITEEITDIGIMAISDMPQLVKLTLHWNNKISAQCWLAFVQRPVMRRLQKLCLLWCFGVNQEVMNVILANPYDLRKLCLKAYGIYCERSFNPGKD